MAELHLVTVAFNRHEWIAEQIRLLQKHLEDEWMLTVLDNSPTPSEAIREVALSTTRTAYERPETPRRMHHEALNHMARRFAEMGDEYIGFLDHDVFPIRRHSLIPKIKQAGFLGIGQRAPQSGNLYPWPGWFFCSREWLAGREMDFTGRDGADTGSGLQPLFTPVDWEGLYAVGHGYEAIRHPDDVGLQSWGVECFSTSKGEPPDWIHLTNGSRWMVVPDIEGRERILMEMLAAK